MNCKLTAVPFLFLMLVLCARLPVPTALLVRRAVGTSPVRAPGELVASLALPSREHGPSSSARPRRRRSPTSPTSLAMASPASAPTPTVLVAAAALLDDRGRILLAQRPPGKSMAGLWEFPGGKVNPGERLEAALARELEEELGIRVDVGAMAPITFASHAYADFYLIMPLFLVEGWTGTPAGKEGQALEWVAATRLGSKPMPPADLPLLAAVEAAARARAVPAGADAT